MSRRWGNSWSVCTNRNALMLSRVVAVHVTSGSSSQNAASAPSREIEISRDRQQDPVRSGYGRARPAIQNSIMTILARLSVGRILLHLLAMLGDRCVRFHLEGIVRELPSIASGLAMLIRMRGRLLAAVTLYLARPIKHSTTNRDSVPQSLAAVLHRGDVLLTRGIRGSPP